MNFLLASQRGGLLCLTAKLLVARLRRLGPKFGIKKQQQTRTTPTMAHSWRIMAFKFHLLQFQTHDSMEQGPKKNPQHYVYKIRKIEPI